MCVRARESQAVVAVGSGSVPDSALSLALPYQTECASVCVRVCVRVFVHVCVETWDLCWLSHQVCSWSRRCSRDA